MIEGMPLDRWSLVPVRKSPQAAVSYAHHLLIDETTTGKATWV